MKNLKYLILFIALAFIPNIALASEYRVTDYFIEAYIHEDGSMTVNELIVPEGSYNGYYFDKGFQMSSATPFTGIETDFNGNSSIYNLGDYSNIYATAINGTGFTFDSLKTAGANYDFTKVTSAYDGQSGVYTLDEYQNSFYVKIYSPGSDNTGFYLTYTVEDAVVVHNDVAELFYPFIDANFEEAIINLEIKVHLPGEASDLRVWTHGTLLGEIDNINNEYAYATYPNTPAYTLTDIRLTFDKSLVPNATKYSNVNGLNAIITLETIKANTANDLREKAIKEEALKDSLRRTARYIFWTYIIGLIFVISIVYKKYDKEYPNPLNSEYNREFVGDYGPAIAAYLLNNKNIGPEAVTTTILDLVTRRVIEVEKIPLKRNKEDYKFILREHKEKLKDYEENLIDWLFVKMGDGTKTITMSKIKEEAKGTRTYNTFVTNYNAFTKKIRKLAINEKFYEEKSKRVKKYGLYSLLGIIVFPLFLGIIDYKGGYGIASTVISVGYLMYLGIFTKKSEKGILHYYSWKGMKKFLTDFGRFNEKELPEIILWEKYLVYAAAFGIADKVEKAMKLKIKEFKLDQNTNFTTNYILLNHSFGNALTSSINSSVRSAVSSAQVAQSRTSSGSGFGGGSSGGSSFGGGGGFSGGGGRF